MRLLKNIGFVLLAVAVLAIWGRYRRRAPHEGAPSGVPVFATEAKASPFGFVPLPQPFIAPPDRLLILAPADCPKEAGQRADDLV
ncbi:MAG TPA: hypothetical protein VKG78_01185, partial [Opitutaceae bacterium]|nr:hypothetical protein [Opitutaceae bacterium]